MFLWQGKSKGTKAGYQVFVWILKKFGIASAYFLLRFVVIYYFLFSYKSSKAIFSLYHHKLKYNKLISIIKLYKNYYLLGQSIIDKVVIMAGIKNKFTFCFEGEDNLQKIKSLQKGGILLSAHIGNWDIASHLLERIEIPIHIVLFDGEHKKIKEYLNKIADKKKIHTIVIKDDLSHIYHINKAFNRNELVCMHADRFLTGNKTLTATFLGEDARLPMGPFLLASTFKVPVSFVFAVKESNYHYHFFASGIKNYENVDKKTAMKIMVADFVREMEKKVKDYPEQWFNYYNFWQ